MPWRTAAAAGLLALLLLGAPSDARKSTKKSSKKSKRLGGGGAGSGPAPAAAGQLRHLMEEAEKALGAGQKDVAVAHYREMVALQPDFEMGHFNLGTTLQEMGQYGEATHHYTRTLALLQLRRVTRGASRCSRASGCCR